MYPTGGSAVECGVIPQKKRQMRPVPLEERCAVSPCPAPAPPPIDTCLCQTKSAHSTTNSGAFTLRPSFPPDHPPAFSVKRGGSDQRARAAATQLPQPRSGSGQAETARGRRQQLSNGSGPTATTVSQRLRKRGAARTTSGGAKQPAGRRGAAASGRRGGGRQP